MHIAVLGAGSWGTTVASLLRMTQVIKAELPGHPAAAPPRPTAA
jgi:glycerol-3-phosphate dehydrogenase